MTKDQVRAAAMALDPKEREVLAEELLLSISDVDRAEIDAAWLAEVRRREEAYRRGESSTSPVNELVARIQHRSIAE
jgi:putative addiction module component (TIGR02574 family)